MARSKREPSFLHAGVDVSQRTLAVAFRARNGELVELKVPNDDAGVQRLLTLFRAGRRPRRVGVESTGAYGLALCVALVEANVEVMLINPLSARRFAQATMTRAKTDRVDARVLLEFTERMAFTPWQPPSPEVRELRSIAGRIQTLVELRTADLNRRHAAQLDPKTPAVVQADIDESIRTVEKRIDALLAAAVDVFASTTELQDAHRVVTSVTGFAHRSAVQILAQLLVLPKDMSPRELTAFAGLDPKTVESGTSVRGAAHISRRGNRALRSALYMPTLCAIQHSPPVNAVYNNLVARGKPKKVAQIAIMRRLLHVLWRLFRTNETWDPAKFGSQTISA